MHKLINRKQRIKTLFFLIAIIHGKWKMLFSFTSFTIFFLVNKIRGMVHKSSLN